MSTRLIRMSCRSSVIRKAAEIEKLAHDVQSRMKN